MQTLLHNLPLALNLGKNMSVIKSVRKYWHTSSSYKLFSDFVSIGIVSLNLVLIVICNVSLLNPGPPDLNGSTTGITVHYQNVQGFVQFPTLRNKHPSLNMTKVLEFQTHIDLTRPDIVVINETWLKPSINNHEILPFSDYKVFRLDRNAHSHPPDPLNPSKFKRNGGGVLIAVKSSLDLKPTLLKSKGHAEFLSITLSLPNRKKICISSCYRVSTLGDDNFNEIKQMISNISRSKNIVAHYLIGDLNLEAINWESNSSTNRLYSKFLSTFDDLGLDQLISSPTHYRGNILDVLLTDKPYNVKELVVHDRNEFTKSDHFFISFYIKLKVKRIRPQPRTIYNFSKANWEALDNDLKHVDWDNGLLHGMGIEAAWSRFKSILFLLCDKHIPKVKIKSKGSPPWFDSDIHNLCLKKDRYRKLFKATGNPSHNTKYKNCRIEVKHKIMEKMRSNFDDTSNPNSLTKKFWSYVKSSSNTSRIPDIVSCKGRFRSEPIDKANLFNNYFCEQFSRQSHYDIDVDFNHDSFLNDFRIDFRTVRSILKSLNANKSYGPDGISGKILKKCHFSLAYPLSILFNLSFNLGQIPKEWKLANVVPVHKKGDKSLVENYRPISLTCLIMKVFERCIRDALLSVCQDSIHPSQHGFLPNKSCTTQLIPFVDELALSLNNSVIVDIVYFDFAKAFDSVNHDIILQKLKSQFNVDGLMLNFLIEYLKGRRQRVVIDQAMSTESDVISGVPQGSILGPLSFVLFVNDMHAVISPGTSIALYADDTKIWRKIGSDVDSTILNNDIESLNRWAYINCMKFHPSKCKVVSNTRKNKVFSNLPFYDFPYCLDGTVLDHCESEKDLGLHIHEGLTWSVQHKELLAKATARFNLLRRTCYFVKNQSHKRTLYLTMVRSIFEHCCCIWAPSSPSIISSFESIQKRAIKWIFCEQFYSYSDAYYMQKLVDLDILPMAQKFLYNDMVLFFKIVNNLIPVDLPLYLTSRSNTRVASHNQCFGFDDEIVKNPIRNVFGKSFFPRCVAAWNSLTPELKSCENINIFQSALKSHLWQTALGGFDSDLETSWESLDIAPD